ncbi:hypothetical protein [Marinobacter sp. F4206]|uniref:hypothetical protein n=1 Tax=Marinobacter sp. F4206 TaxID=2861777 RepID=UPI001C5F0956|nr:hypothetical protein [Marinobacter sp. F4206]MBW4935562.1 hypothetical protein [Marinobacter sp. F4206]
MHIKWKFFPLVLFFAQTGCGGTGSGESNLEPSTAAGDNSFKVESVDAPVCSNTVTDLPGCWVSTCESIELEDGDFAYQRTVISFAESGVLRHYGQRFDNANCIGPEVDTKHVFTDIKFELLPRDESVDSSLVDGRRAFTFDYEAFGLSEDIGPRGTVYSLDSGLPSGNQLCYDTSVVSIYGSSIGFHPDSPALGTVVTFGDYCLTQLNQP